MEELRAELAVLEEKYKAVLNEIEKYQDLTTSLHVDSEHLETEMFGVRRKIEALLPVLSDDEKKSLKRDLDYIGKINSDLL
jgi:chromosome segregation ATPase